ncbi:MAG TPA: MurR/RpiR family transcriptional regulator [Syntrophales bacterium]|nr:MurR/RpiR family transcriptional regulator [Syntrophales bacterium]
MTPPRKKRTSPAGAKSLPAGPENDGLDTLFAHIKEFLGASTRSQRLVAAYFLEHSEQAVFMSIPQLAAAVGVSTATITRFAQELGYASFSTFQKDLQGRVKSRLKPTTRLMERAGLNGQVHDKIRRYGEHDMLNIQKTFEKINPEELQDVVRMIIRSRWVWTVGMRGSHILARDLSYNLNKILRKSSLINLGAADYIESMVAVQPGDLIFAFSFSRFTRETTQIVRMAKEQGAIAVVFTDRIISPLTPYSDKSFVIEVEGLGFRNSYVAVLSLLNCILAEVALGAKEASMENLKDLDERLLKNDAFLFA